MAEAADGPAGGWTFEVAAAAAEAAGQLPLLLLRLITRMPWEAKQLRA